MRRSGIVTALSLVLLVGATTDVLAHARLKIDGLVKPRSVNAGIKTGPCGNVARTSTPTVLAPGQTIDIEWEETVDHPGSFKFSFSPANDQGFDTNLLKEVVDTQNTAPIPHFYKTTLTLPNVSCTACTLQLIQVMTDTNPASFYYSCADIQLVAADFAPPANATDLAAAVSDGRTVLTWTNPTVDFGQAIVLQSSSPSSATLVNGTSYVVGTPLGNSTVVYAGTANTATITNLTNGQMYYFKVFTVSPRLFYASGIEVSVLPAAVNAAASVSLQARQAGRAGTQFSTTGGAVTVTAKVVDQNSNDTHQFDWSDSAATLIDFDTDPATFSFDPSRAAPGSYRLVVQVTDTGTPPATTIQELQLTLAAPAASAPTTGTTPAKTAARASGGGGSVPHAAMAILFVLALISRKRGKLGHTAIALT